MIRQPAVREIKLVDDLIPCPAAEESLAAVREFQPIESFVKFGCRGHLPGNEVNNKDLVLAIAGVQHGCEPPLGVNGYVYGKIAQVHLPTHWPERPQVW